MGSDSSIFQMDSPSRQERKRRNSFKVYWSLWLRNSTHFARVFLIMAKIHFHTKRRFSLTKYLQMYRLSCWDSFDSLYPVSYLQFRMKKDDMSDPETRYFCSLIFTKIHEAQIKWLRTFSKTNSSNSHYGLFEWTHSSIQYPTDKSPKCKLKSYVALLTQFNRDSWIQIMWFIPPERKTRTSSFYAHKRLTVCL